ncbi:hypothetical protein FHW36_105420 [Chitinophaga polysaccharea]|uniref:Lipoprotein n=1 Tax=Chitinophaga polysaccharea TaxID=1293035 RepID=A0A561PPE1_9BACT|nr:hypothetical protein [Chitinophaga polysaccharea]TWF39979.1 hypothetical protein FHW36_105420 [Chitinophaga polysaccharea]
MRAPILLTALVVTTMAISNIASAQNQLPETKWQKNHPNWTANHPGRTEVNDRLANQDRRINREVRNGEISRAQANKMHWEDRSVRREERKMAARNGGHLTHGEVATLNHRENRISRRIGH